MVRSGHRWFIPPAARLKYIVFFINGVQEFRLVFLPEADFHPGRKVAGPAGGKSAGGIAVNRHFIKDLPVVVPQHFHAIYAAVLMGDRLKCKIREINKTVIINIQVSEIINFFFIQPDFILVQLFNLFLRSAEKEPFFPY